MRNKSLVVSILFVILGLRNPFELLLFAPFELLFGRLVLPCSVILIAKVFLTEDKFFVEIGLSISFAQTHSWLAQVTM